MSYTAVFPTHLFFYCSIAATDGGETTYGDSRRILQRLDADIARRFRAKGVRYDRHLSGHEGTGYSWKEAFATSNRADVEKRCSRLGAVCEWSEDGSVRISEVRPATTHHPETGEEVWFNQADGFHADEYNGSDPFDPRLDSYYGDGTPLELDVLAEIRRVVRSETIPHTWQEGDLLVLDNVLAAHGRAPFAGQRRILLAMT